MEIHLCDESSAWIDRTAIILFSVSRVGEAEGDSASASKVEGWILFGLVVVDISKQG